MDAPLNTLIIGIGNRFRGDDAAGPCVIDRLNSDPIRGAVVLESSGEIAELIEKWDKADLVFVADAVSSGSPAGTIHRFEVNREPLPVSAFQTSTHAFSLAEAVELARTLGRLPQRLVVYGIEGNDFGHGCDLSGPVTMAIETVASRIRAEIVRYESGAACKVGKTT